MVLKIILSVIAVVFLGLGIYSAVSFPSQGSGLMGPGSLEFALAVAFGILADSARVAAPRGMGGITRLKGEVTMRMTRGFKFVLAHLCVLAGSILAWQASNSLSTGAMLLFFADAFVWALDAC